MSNNRSDVAQAWKQFGTVAPPALIEDLMYEAAGRNLVATSGDPIATGQLIGRRDLALEILNKMGVT